MKREASITALTAKAAPALKTAGVNSYETQEYVDQYLLFHYGRPRDLCPFRFIAEENLRFHRLLLDECLLPVASAGPTRGLDIGCGVGRFTFELGRVLDQVEGIDNSKAFIQAAQTMAQMQAMTVRVKESGERFRMCALVLPRELRHSRVVFRVGDAEEANLFAHQPAQVVAAINLICRLSHPQQFLAQLHQLVMPGGQLILASPFSWLEEYTPQREWLTPEEVTKVLSPHFRLARRRELPFIIREHRRKYELVVSRVSTFLRK